MEVTIRIDGNKDYDYAKETLTLINDVIYIVESNCDGRLSLHLLNDGYIKYAQTKYSDNVPELLKLIINNYYDIAMGIKFIQKSKDGSYIKNVANIQGLTISDW